MAEIAQLVPICQTDIEQLVAFAKSESIDITVVGPEVPLLLGIVDEFKAAGLGIYGPSAAAAMLEGSKAFAKELMFKYEIPTASYEVFSSLEDALEYVKGQRMPLVIKADGLAAGKGVIIAHSEEQARKALQEIMDEDIFGSAGSTVVIEEFLEGEEISLMAFVDGETVLPLLPAQDHKAAFDNDQGPNTGGMGAYCPVPQVKPATLQRAYEQILVPTAKALTREGRPFQGILYAGLMLTANGPKVIEFNVRFGDPEAQVLLPLLRTDLIEVILATLDHSLHNIAVDWFDGSAVTVVLASGGYPGQFNKGLEIKEQEIANANILVFHAGTAKQQGRLVTNGGRVLAITAVGEELEHTRDLVYTAGVSSFSFSNMHYRQDIAAKALKLAK